MQALQRKDIAYVLYGGAAGGGKSFLGCAWLLMSCLQYPRTKYFIGRQTLKEIRGSTLPSFYKAFQIIGLPLDLFKVNLQDNYILFNNESRIDLLNLDHQPTDPFYERFGSFEFTSGWIEEAGEVAFEAFDTLKARVGRHLNDQYNIPSKILITCNPKKNWLYERYYKPWRDNNTDGTFVFIPAKASDNTELDAEYINNLYNISDNIKRERLLNGNWEYDADPNSLVEYDKITDIFTNPPSTGRRYITADIANVGKDSTVIILWNQFTMEKIIQLNQSNTVEISGKIKELSILHNIPMSQILVDANGLGVGVKDTLHCKGFINNSKPVGNEKYDMLKSQCAFKLAEMINRNIISCLPIDSKLQDKMITELTQLKQWKADDDRQIKLIPKEQMKRNIGRSPDFLDAMLMRMYFELVQVGKVSVLYQRETEAAGYE
jgi:hypothetical protein